MPLVIPFSQCVARPPLDGQAHWLSEHLDRVAVGCGSADGDCDQKLAYLAGLLHDAAKCHGQWQDYIQGRSRRGPPHAPFGAALFAYFAHRMADRLADQGQRERCLDAIPEWTQAVDSHHGRLDDLCPKLPPWDATAAIRGVEELLSGCDLPGLFSFVDQRMAGLDPNPSQFAHWLDAYPRQWERLMLNGRPRILRRRQAPLPQVALRLANASAVLVRADRFDAGSMSAMVLTTNQAAEAIARLEGYCREQADRALAGGAGRPLVAARGRAQASALERYRGAPQTPIWTLSLPTGYGKTLTALRVALEACANATCHRIVYVAPYISILSQASREIHKASGIEVFEHHHLSLARKGSDGAGDEESEDHSFDALDSWEAPVLATTFNQFFRALFPKRAQETLRIPALGEAFIIVDEPQIISADGWNVFLRALEETCRRWKCKALFATATMPPVWAGLSQSPVSLASETPIQDRFRIRFREDVFDSERLVDLCLRSIRREPTLAVILNSVREAAEIYRRLVDRFGGRTYCLTAAMLAGHKASVIEAIRNDLRAGRETVVVCTQVLEAGVDLSFRRILRALPVFPSIAQAAGRANRNGEGGQAEVHVFRLAGKEGRESRPWVYRDATARRQTDALLAQTPDLAEGALPQSLNEYFARCWRENPRSQSLEAFERAARGAWSELAGMEPFADSGPRRDVFVPVEVGSAIPGVEETLSNIGIDSSEELLERYFDAQYRRGLGRLERRRLSQRLRQFIVSISPSVAESVASPLNDWLWRLYNMEAYSPETGLAHLCLGESEEWTIV